METKHKWYEKQLGIKLSKCDCPTNSACCLTGDVIKNTSVIGLYFSFANINLKSDDFIKKLRELYDRLNSDRTSEMKRLEIVQIVLWVNNDVYSDFENTHRESLIGSPWYAVPLDEIELKGRLSRRYRIKSGVPTLVLLDKDGGTISVSAHEKLLEDPQGLHFPWRPRPADQVLKDIALTPGGTLNRDQHSGRGVYYKDLPPGIKGFYFSANWCPPCRAFTPQLIEVYKTIRKKEAGFEIIFISSDRSLESFNAYLENMPWLAVPFQQTTVRAELAQLYGIRGIPTLLLLDNNGHVITMDARTELAEDPLAQNFPWKPRPVNILTERYIAKLQDYPAVVLFVEGSEDTEIQFAESMLTPAAQAYYEKRNINFAAICDDLFLNDPEQDNCLRFLIGSDSETSDVLRDLIGLDDDLVPLLVGIDIPNRRFAQMEYGANELNSEGISKFVEQFQNGEVEFIDINDEQQNVDAEGIKSNLL